MTGMVYVSDLSIPKKQLQTKINKELESTLTNMAIVEWTPICITGRRIIDGLQRVLIARKHGIKEIPCRRVK